MRENFFELVRGYGWCRVMRGTWRAAELDLTQFCGGAGAAVSPRSPEWPVTNDVCARILVVFWEFVNLGGKFSENEV